MSPSARADRCSEHALDPDRTGVFALEDLAAGRVRVSLTRAGGVTVVTPWTVL